MGAAVRRLITFSCTGETLFGTLDTPDGAASTTGLLIVSGGSEIRIGAHRGMAELATTLAVSGHPVFRFDRRGIGDSTGENGGFRGSEADIVAAAQAFRAEVPDLGQVIAFGNCDAATALVLFHRAAGLDGLVLANPWLGDEPDGLPPASAIRARYAHRMRDPDSWRRLIKGQIDFGSLINGLRKISGREGEEPPPLLQAVGEAFGNAMVPITILLASGDNTAIAFADAWRSQRFDPVRGKVAVRTCQTASHSFARATDKAWLAAQLADLLRD